MTDHFKDFPDKETSGLKAKVQKVRLDYFGKDPYFADIATAEAYHRATYRSFGDLSDAQWRHLTPSRTWESPFWSGSFSFLFDLPFLPHCS